MDAKLSETIELARHALARRRRAPPEAIVDPRAIVHEMRLFKEPEELDMMRRAAEISREGHEAAARLAREGVYEYELEAALDYTFRRRGGAGPAYEIDRRRRRERDDPPLRRATISRCADGELVLIDAGCELAGYASDVTRTYPVGGRFSGRRARRLRGRARRAAGGARGVATGQHARRRARGRAARPRAGHDRPGARSSGSLDDAIQSDAYKTFYMHRTSHWLGLDVHDVGAYAVGGKPRPLAPGMVFTVEPGLYVPLRDEKAPAHLRGIGVRIEDDVRRHRRRPREPDRGDSEDASRTSKRCSR